MATPWDFHLLTTRQAHLPHIDTLLAERLHNRELATRWPPAHQQQPPTTPPSAHALVCAARVANTPELTELILQHLPPIDIVRCTRVNIPFRNLIHTSPTLQRKLFKRAPKPSTPVEHCQFVQWGPGLEQRHIVPLPQPSVVDDVAIEALAKPRSKTFQEMMILYRPAVKMALLCPLLEVAESTPTIPGDWNWRWAFSAPPGSHGPPTTTARFREILAFMPMQPWAAASAHNGATALGSSSSSTWATTLAMITAPLLHNSGWTHMQLSNPPTHHAHMKLCLEGRMYGELRVVLEAARCMQRSADEPGITVHDLIYHTSREIGSVAIETPYLQTVDFRPEEKWTQEVKGFTTVTACVAEIMQREFWGSRYKWSIGTRSEVTLRGVVVSTEGELERLAETGWLSSTPVPLMFELKEPGVEEEERDQEDQEDHEDHQDQEDEEDEEDVSESGSETPTG
jgi:hypothetical protein